eukprot:scaffold30437_cov31-Tisochrysis_lutea.AAC.2
MVVVGPRPRAPTNSKWQPMSHLLTRKPAVPPQKTATNHAHRSPRSSFPLPLPMRHFINSRYPSGLIGGETSAGQMRDQHRLVRPFKALHGRASGQRVEERRRSCKFLDLCAYVHHVMDTLGPRPYPAGSAPNRARPVSSA